MRRSGRIARTSATRDLIVSAERGSRLPWARATRAGAVIGGLLSGSGASGWSSCVDPALGLAGAGPAAAAGVLARRDAPGAGPAADRRVAVVAERVDQDVVLDDVGVDLVLRPARER